jgi:hypothetical protein
MAILSSITSLIWTAAQAALPLAESADLPTQGIGSALLGLCFGLIGPFVTFYVTSGLTYLGARVFGGNGSFGTQTYLASLSTVPMLLATALVNLVPCLGTIVALFLAVYATVLDVRSVKVAHNLTTGRAVAAILVPMLIVLLFLCCCPGALGLLAG